MAERTGEGCCEACNKSQSVYTSWAILFHQVECPQAGYVLLPVGTCFRVSIMRLAGVFSFRDVRSLSLPRSIWIRTALRPSSSTALSKRWRMGVSSCALLQIWRSSAGTMGRCATPSTARTHCGPSTAMRWRSGFFCSASRYVVRRSHSCFLGVSNHFTASL
jgi:hypothetical protein